MADNKPEIVQDSVNEDGVRIVYANTCGRVCSSQIGLAVKDGIILQAAFAGGCAGNTEGVARLCRGLGVEEAIRRLEGIDCNGKGTSCPDQLAQTLKMVL